MPDSETIFMKNKGGSTPTFETDVALENAIDDYFKLLAYTTTEEAKENGVKTIFPSVTGLALHLGFESRQSIYDFKEIEKHAYTIKRAITAIEYHYEQGLNTTRTSGAIFALKNSGWKDTPATTVKVEQSKIDYSNLTKKEIETLVSIQDKMDGNN